MLQLPSFPVDAHCGIILDVDDYLAIQLDDAAMGSSPAAGGGRPSLSPSTAASCLLDTGSSPPDDPRRGRRGNHLFSAASFLRAVEGAIAEVVSSHRRTYTQPHAAAAVANTPSAAASLCTEEEGPQARGKRGVTTGVRVVDDDTAAVAGTSGTRFDYTLPASAFCIVTAAGHARVVWSPLSRPTAGTSPTNSVSLIVDDPSTKAARATTLAVWDGDASSLSHGEGREGSLYAWTPTTNAGGMIQSGDQLPLFMAQVAEWWSDARLWHAMHALAPPNIARHATANVQSFLADVLRLGVRRHVVVRPPSGPAAVSAPSIPRDASSSSRHPMISAFRLALCVSARLRRSHPQQQNSGIQTNGAAREGPDGGCQNEKRIGLVGVQTVLYVVSFTSQGGVLVDEEKTIPITDVTATTATDWGLPTVMESVVVSGLRQHHVAVVHLTCHVRREAKGGGVGVEGPPPGCCVAEDDDDSPEQPRSHRHRMAGSRRPRCSGGGVLERVMSLLDPPVSPPPPSPSISSNAPRDGLRDPPDGVDPSKKFENRRSQRPRGAGTETAPPLNDLKGWLVDEVLGFAHHRGGELQYVVRAV